MSINPQQVGAQAMRFMETLEDHFGEDAVLDTVAFLAVVDRGGETSIQWQFAKADGRPVAMHVGRGILAEVDRGLTAG